jgi:hypothetical protein
LEDIKNNDYSSFFVLILLFYKKKEKNKIYNAEKFIMISVFFRVFFSSLSEITKIPCLASCRFSDSKYSGGEEPPIFFLIAGRDGL